MKSAYSNQRCGNAAAFIQQYIVRRGGAAGRLKIDGDIGLLAPLADPRRQRNRIAPGADHQEIDYVRFCKYTCERLLGYFLRIEDRPRINPARHDQKRTAMRHARETEATLSVSVDGRAAREMRIVLVDVHGVTRAGVLPAVDS